MAVVDLKALAARHVQAAAVNAELVHDGGVKISDVLAVFNGVLSTENRPDRQLVAIARAAPGLVGRNLVKTVSGPEPIAWAEDLGRWRPMQGAVEPPPGGHRVVVIDCGAKLNILRNLADTGCEVTIVPFDSEPERILEYKPDGLFVSNGPGDPEAVAATIQSLKALLGRLPIFGICLGHQLLSLALGATTFKLKFGHRGANQPVQNLFTKRVEITSQNHGFAVETQSLQKVGGEPTHINLNDQTLEGFRHASEPIFAVQYHPEASPGPHDARYLFDCFLHMINSGHSPTAEEMGQAQRCRNQSSAQLSNRAK